MTIEVSHRVIADRYRDSVTLLALSARLRAVAGIEAASAVMATPANLTTLAEAGFPVPIGLTPSDLLVSVRGEQAARVEALDLLESLLSPPPHDPASPRPADRPRALLHAMVPADGAGLAMISVPGAYAAAEAAKALASGLHVMVFSDNVSVDDEVSLKSFADRHDLLMMGPDCGTAIINGVPLGFANVVRRGPIAVIGASGTGMQEITARIHRLGSGVSQAIGTGGRDLYDAVAARTMLHALGAIADDHSTEVVVLVSKPPSATVLDLVLARIGALRAQGRLRIPVIGAFLGIDETALANHDVICADTLAQAADLAVALAPGVDREPDAEVATQPEPMRAIDGRVAGMDGPRRQLRAAFCGGTFCYETQVVLARRGIRVASNTPISANPSVAAAGRDEPKWPESHTVLDLGADEFTVGRPHPMIDPTLRDDHLEHAWRDPQTAVILFDVVLGHGSAARPVEALLKRLGGLRYRTPAIGQAVAIAHVCGTALDPQGRNAIIANLREAGVLVADSNAEAAEWAAHALHEIDRRAARAAAS